MSGDTPRTETDAQLLPTGLPRRTRSASPASRLRAETAEVAGEDNDAEDTLSPDALARAMVAIQRGSLRARLAGPDEGRRTPRPGPGTD